MCSRTISPIVCRHSAVCIVVPPETKAFAPCRWYIESILFCQPPGCGQRQTMSIREKLLSLAAALECQHYH
jgi:hypothetical protein